MRTFFILLAAMLLMLLVVLGGCGFLSGTMFVSQKVGDEYTVEAESGGAAVRGGDPGSLDEVFRGAKVDLRDNSDWQDIDIDGIEDICVRLTVVNLLPDSMSGEAWITVGEDSTYADIDSVEAHGGFRIFSGLLCGPNETLTYPCSETFELFENLDQLVDAVKTGVFWVWGRGDQDVYHFKYEAIYLGMHVTGSL